MITFRTKENYKKALVLKRKKPPTSGFKAFAFEEDLKTHANRLENINS